MQTLTPSIASSDKCLIHIGWIKFLSPKGFGFIVDFFDNTDIFFHVSNIERQPLSDDIVAFKVRLSRRKKDCYEAFDIMHPFYHKNELLSQFSLYPKGLQELIRYFIPSLSFSFNDGCHRQIETLLSKYDTIFSNLHDYVSVFDIEDFLKSYYVKIEYYCSASTKDWDINSLDYNSKIGDNYRNLKSIYSRCNPYEESLVHDSRIRHMYLYDVFDYYLADISYKSDNIKTTTAYGSDSSFMNGLDRKDLESMIPQITNKWKNEIRDTYNKKDHFLSLANNLLPIYSSLIDNIPMFIDSSGKEMVYWNGPSCNVSLSFDNGSIHIRSTKYMSAKGYGYELMHTYEGYTTKVEQRDLLEVDSDEKDLISYVEEVKSHSADLFRKQMEKYLRF